jgi:hypothetical protein
VEVATELEEDVLVPVAVPAATIPDAPGAALTGAPLKGFMTKTNAETTASPTRRSIE